MNRATLAAAAIATLALTAALLTAGPLNPPPGAPTPTYKTLAQVEPRTPISAAPFIIDAPGSYYLTGNIQTAPNAVYAIFIAASNVTLDLNGFTVQGGETAILLEGNPVSNITIRNGNVRGTTGSGIFVRLTPGPGHTVRNITLESITDAAILLGPEASVSDVRISNAGDGVLVGEASIITNVSIDSPTRSGFTVGPASIIEGCTVLSSLGPPAFSGHGFSLAQGAAASNCVARSNAGPGFILEPGAIARHCTATDNLGGGFVLGSHARLDRCTSISNAAAPGVIVRSNTTGWTIERSTINANTNGIAVGGISSQGAIRNNSIRGLGTSTGAGILINTTTTGDITILGNTIAVAQRGIILDGIFCSILGNAFTGLGAAVTNSSGGTPSNTNFIAPIVSAATAPTTTNALVNTQN